MISRGYHPGKTVQLITATPGNQPAQPIRIRSKSDLARMRERVAETFSSLKNPGSTKSPCRSAAERPNRQRQVDKDSRRRRHLLQAAPRSRQPNRGHCAADTQAWRRANRDVRRRAPDSSIKQAIIRGRYAETPRTPASRCASGRMRPSVRTAHDLNRRPSVQQRQRQK